jgi:hypothetical protein
MKDLTDFRALLRSSDPVDRLKAINLHYDFPLMAVTRDDIVDLLRDSDSRVRCAALETILVNEFPFHDAELAADLLKSENSPDCQLKLAQLLTWRFREQFVHDASLSQICMPIFDSHETEGDWVVLTKFILISEQDRGIWKKVLHVMERIRGGTFEERQAAQAVLRFMGSTCATRCWLMRRKIRSLVGKLARRSDYDEIGNCAREVQKQL